MDDIQRKEILGNLSGAEYDAVKLTVDQLQKENYELRTALHEWWQARNNLSSDCQKLGIGSSIQDTPKWAEELSKRCEPLRKFCDTYFSKETEELTQVADYIDQLRAENETLKNVSTLKEQQ